MGPSLRRSKPIGRRSSQDPTPSMRRSRNYARFFNERAVSLIDHRESFRVSDMASSPTGLLISSWSFSKETLSQRQKQKGMLLPLPECCGWRGRLPQHWRRRTKGRLSPRPEAGQRHAGARCRLGGAGPRAGQAAHSGIAKVSAQPESATFRPWPRTSTIGHGHTALPAAVPRRDQSTDKADLLFAGHHAVRDACRTRPFVGGSRRKCWRAHLRAAAAAARTFHVPGTWPRSSIGFNRQEEEERPRRLREVWCLAGAAFSGDTDGGAGRSRCRCCRGLWHDAAGSSRRWRGAAGLSGVPSVTLRPIPLERAQADGREAPAGSAGSGERRRAAHRHAGGRGAALTRTSPPPPPPPTSPRRKRRNKVKKGHWSLNSIPQGRWSSDTADGRVLGTTPWTADRPGRRWDAGRTANCATQWLR